MLFLAILVTLNSFPFDLWTFRFQILKIENIVNNKSFFSLIMASTIHGFYFRSCGAEKVNGTWISWQSTVNCQSSKILWLRPFKVNCISITTYFPSRCLPKCKSREKRPCSMHVRFRKRWHSTTRHHITIWLQLARFNCINRNKVEQLSTDLSLAISHVFYNPMIPYVPSSRPLHH